MNQPLKRCTSCNQEFPATSDYFHRHKSRKDGLASICKTCANQARQQTYVAQREKILERQKEYYQAHKDERASYMQEWNARNQEYRRDYNKEYSRLNRETISQQKKKYYRLNRGRLKEMNHYHYRKSQSKRLEYARTYRQIHRNKRSAYGFAYYWRNRESMSLYQRLRYHKMRTSATENITPQDIDRLYETQNGCCYWCSIPVGKTYHIDHVFPIVRGGSHTLDNLVISCPSCNQSKHDKLPYTEWIPSNPLAPNHISISSNLSAAVPSVCENAGITRPTATSTVDPVPSSRPPSVSDI